jgi:hypothetical protein
MATVAEFQQRLLTDPEARRAFAANPRQYLADNGLQLPEGVELPESLDINVLDQQANQVGANIADQSASLERLNPANVTDVTDFIAATVPVINRDLDVAASVHDRLREGGAISLDPAARATVAVIAAVVAAVVAVPVAVYGVVAESVEQNLLPASGIRRVTRGATGLTLEGPHGLRVAGLTVDEVAQIIRSERD